METFEPFDKNMKLAVKYRNLNCKKVQRILHILDPHHDIFEITAEYQAG